MSFIREVKTVNSDIRVHIDMLSALYIVILEARCVLCPHRAEESGGWEELILRLYEINEN
jgi:hypothetical protein